MCRSVYLHIFMCTTCMPSTYRVSDMLEPGLQVVVSQHVGTGNQTQVHCKSNKSQPLAYKFLEVIFKTSKT